jgi:DNA replication protein DnaC
VNDLAGSLKALGLFHTSANLDAFVQQHKRASPRELLQALVVAEEAERKRRSLERRSRRCRVAKFVPMADFDWSWPKTIPRQPIEAALTLDFVDAAENIVLIGPAGVGKTMIAKTLVHSAVLKGYSALFITAAELLNDLAKRETAAALERRLKFYCQSTALLCIDEVGYISYESRGADLLFQILSRRHEKRSLVLTSNLAFSDWHTVFPNAACTVAMIDRLVEHASIIEIDGTSWRKRNAEKKATSRAAKPNAKR